MKVLVVDDSESIRYIIKDTLLAQGIDVEVAENGADALTKYATFKPHLVTLDLLMPIMDGYETLMRLRKSDPNSNIIMLTVLDNWNSIERCIDKGAIGFLPKPFSIDQLINTIMNPWRYDDKNFITLFLIIISRISDILIKILDSTARISLKNIEIIRTAEINVPQLSVGLKERTLNLTENLTNLIIQNCVDMRGYISTFNGHQHGKIISFIKEKDVGPLTRSAYGYFLNKDSTCQEIFNIINGKIFTSITDSANLILSCEPVRLYNDETDKVTLPKWEAIKGIFEITTDTMKIPFETQIWGNINVLANKKMLQFGK